MKFFFVLALAVLCIGVPCSTADILKPLRNIEDIKFCGEKVPLEIEQVRHRLEKEVLLALDNRAQSVLWIKRAPRFFPYISAQLKENRMPDDLKYLAVAESALRAHAGSSKAAIGYWQLVPATARKYGLRVDGKIDERRKLETSTRAALKHLKYLNKIFGSWSLAAAAYNMGEQGLAAEILEQKVKSYYKLYLSLETQRFVFRILTAKLIISDPAHYGFNVEPEDLYQPIKRKIVQIHCYDRTPIRLIAEAAVSHFKLIKDLNPHFRGHYLYEGKYELHLPETSPKKFQKKLDILTEEFKKQEQHYIYVVKRGDSMSKIADKFDVPLAAIIIWNRIDHNRPIHPGQRLVIYPYQLKDIEP
ncbi:MAG: transglycosylase SLT domain-containing protein [Desulfobacteraceae bacterium]|nr:transglycosylase SLT domain-containing protein [Desulfobacteraceae bacterium]